MAANSATYLRRVQRQPGGCQLLHVKVTINDIPTWLLGVRRHAVLGQLSGLPLTLASPSAS
jgi:hypothetical protein